MRTSIASVVFMITSFAVSAQQDSVRFEYCVLTSSGNIDSTPIQIKLDFGTRRDVGYLKNPSTGKALKFNSIVDALNYLGKSGWEVISVTTVSASFLDHRYFLKRRTPSTRRE